tara:strand:- start:2071 stop:3465 length:1395 start_codon:yes stop_codon:yes gene_type:complete
MATFKEISAADIKTARSALNQLVDIVQEDVSGSNTRKKYQIFVTGGVGPGVTSSLFQTVFDQDFSLQTANAIFDITIGLFESGSTVVSSSTGQDSTGKLLFPSTSLMMREKVDTYKQFAQVLLGDSNAAFFSPFGGSTANDANEAVGGLLNERINNAMFLCFKRLFSRDKIKRETFAMRFYQSASHAPLDHAGANHQPGPPPHTSGSNIGIYDGDSGGGYDDNDTHQPSNQTQTSTSGSAIFTDLGSSTNKLTSFGGEVGNIVDSANTARKVGLMFYDAGIAVFDLSRIMSGSQHASGTIDAMRAGSTTAYSIQGNHTTAAGRVIMGCVEPIILSGNPGAKFIPDFMVSASMDNIIDHLCRTRFQSGSLTAATFQNVTNINSTLIFCRATADEFNYSSNPTFIDTANRIRVIDEGQEDTQRAFSFPTTVGLYDANDNLLAVAKMSRPIEKNDEKDLTVRVRLDF